VNGLSLRFAVVFDQLFHCPLEISIVDEIALLISATV
jgi:hypothetical protein